jgi:hypothetical protein
MKFKNFVPTIYLTESDREDVSDQEMVKGGYFTDDNCSQKTEKLDIDKDSDQDLQAVNNMLLDDDDKDKVKLANEKELEDVEMLSANFSDKKSQDDSIEIVEVMDGAKFSDKNSEDSNDDEVQERKMIREIDHHLKDKLKKEITYDRKDEI